MPDIYTLSNGSIAIAVKRHGAELASLCCDGREYLWQADPRYWQRHSPVLFPIVGSVWNGEFRIDGTAYKMGQHGFARDMDFELESLASNEIWMSLHADAATLAKYPYAFVLHIGYKIAGRSVEVMWRVENAGDTPMHFQIGAHPAFYWPMLDNAVIEAGVDAMEPVLAATDNRGWMHIDATSDVLTKSVITEGGCVGGTSQFSLEPGGYLPLTIETFSRDALVLEDTQTSGVTICDVDKRPYLTVKYDSPLVGIWSSPGKRAPFVCIEPWYGRCDRAHYSGEFKDKEWMRHLAPGARFDASYQIIVH